MVSTQNLIPLRRSRHQAAADFDASQALRLAGDLRSVMRGEVCFDQSSRALFATDASNFRQVPIGVIRPRDAEDVVLALDVCRAHGAPVLGSGGRTSLAGQCCNVAVVFDFARYMNRVLWVDPERRLARVQAGAVLDDLRHAAKQHRLTFGPDPATHSHCTLGGMIGNNSCGTHAVQAEFYGPGPRTEHSVETLDVVRYDGTRLELGSMSEAELVSSEPARAHDEFLRALGDLRNRYESAIRRGFPEIPRCVSGYNLRALLPERGFNLAHALCGSEGTCALTLEATLRLIDERPERVMVLLGYDDIYRAADDIPRIREFRPIACEGIDDVLVSFNELKGNHLPALALFPRGNAWLLVEFGADERGEAEERAAGLIGVLERDPSGPSLRVLHDDEQQANVWLVRESGLGATSFVPGHPDSWAGWEDSAVPPERLGGYLRDFRRLLKEFGYECAFYGHFAHGCLHVNIDFDLSSHDGVERYKEFTERAALLVTSYGGSLSGEHGDGQQRGDLLQIMFGDELMQAFREFKSLWDPDNRMNPGKLIDAFPRDTNLRLGPYYEPWQPATHFAYREDGGKFEHATIRCVGIGECRKKQGGVMCPSFMVTHEEKHTTRGRAHLLHEMLRGDVIRDGWHSEEVKESLELCLSCKGCKGECPVNVDIATYKAEFLSHYYDGKLRPRHAYAFGLIPYLAPLGSSLAPLANFFTQAPALGSLAKLAADMAQERRFPKFAKKSFRRWFQKRGQPQDGRMRVVLWPDTFNDFFFPQTLLAAVNVLESAGCQVVIPKKRLCCGRPLYDYGMLDKARHLLRRLLGALAPEIAEGTPVVGIEPSCVAVLRDELRDLFPNDGRAQRLAENTLTLAEFLDQRLIHYRPPSLDWHALLHGHCHHAAIMKLDSERNVLRAMGLDVETLDSGCCGMAGAFGFEAGKYELSMAIGERVLLPAVRTASDQTLIVADGFSCREQILQATDRQALHLAEVIDLALRREEVRKLGARPEDQFHELVPPELYPAESHAAVASAIAGVVAGSIGALYWLF